MRRLMEYIGMEPERLQASWVSAAEAQKFQQLITEVTEQIRALGPNRKLRDVQWEQWNN